MLLESEPRFANGAEREVWNLLVAGLGDADLVGANVRVTHEGRDREIDLLVGLAGLGVVSIEVKGGTVWRLGDGWRMRRGGKDVKVDPVDQARKGKYALQTYLAGDARWGRRRVRWAHAVVLPHTAVDADFATPDCPREAIFGRDDLDDLAGGLRRLLTRSDHEVDPPTEADLTELREVLGGRMPPQADVIAEAHGRAADADLRTEQQALVLDAIRMLRRVEVRGGAGSGKTWLALEQARRLTAQGERVALVCYSRGLAAYMNRWVAALPSHRQRAAYVGTFHGLGARWGATLPGTDDDSEAWEVRLPAQMAALADELPDGQRFDAVVVDEAQDFSDSWWPAMLGALRTEDSGVYAFTDEGQRVFARFGRPTISLLPLMLDVNLRNTRQIGETFGDLAPFRMKLRGGDGPAVRLVECSPTEAVARADDVVEELLAQWRPRDVALLTTGHRHPEQSALQAEGQDAYWDTFWDDDLVFYGHVLGFKGLERRVVVLALNEHEPGERSRERLYVGMSRARDQLVVCGDPAFVADVGGPRLLERLRANT